MRELLRSINEFSGVLLLVLVVLVSYAVQLLAGIKWELTCLHDDFNDVHDTHREPRE
jgi:hypothetical protein